MGQYYVPYLTDGEKEMTLLSHDYDSGLKLTEHSWLGNTFVNTVMSLIEDNPMKVAWVGDYSRDVGASQELYNVCWGDEDVKTRVTPEPKNYFWDLETNSVKAFGYLINHSKCEFIDLKEYQKIATYRPSWDDSDWCMHPLPLLTAIGNGLGGGDYWNGYPNCDEVGDWFLDKIEFSKHEPEQHFDDVTEHYVFKEVKE